MSSQYERDALEFGAKRTEQRCGELVSPVVEALGYRLWGVECKGGGRSATLRVFIDTNPPGGITIADVEQVSRQVSMLLDMEDPIRGAYQLEVSSPGVDRRFFTLDQCEGYVGNTVSLRLKMLHEGRRTFSGRLAEVGVDSGALVLELDDDGQRRGFRFSDVREMNLVWDGTNDMEIQEGTAQ